MNSFKYKKTELWHRFFANLKDFTQNKIIIRDIKYAIPILNKLIGYIFINLIARKICVILHTSSKLQVSHNEIVQLNLF